MIYGAKFSFCLLLLLSFPVIMATKPILSFWLGHYPSHAVAFIRLMIIISLIESITYAMGAGLRAVGKVKWYEISVGVTLMLSLPVAYILLRSGQPPQSIFFGMILLSLVAVGLRMWLMKIYIPLFSLKDFRRRVIFPILGLCAVCTLFFIAFNTLDILSSMNMMTVIALSLISVGGAIPILGFNSNERNHIRNLVYRKIRLK